MFEAIYKFKNGVIATFTLEKGTNRPICEWSCELNKKNIAPLLDEYVDSCVPIIYQQVADYLGQTILWVDKHMTTEAKQFYPKRQPSNINEYGSSN